MKEPYFLKMTGHYYWVLQGYKMSGSTDENTVDSDTMRALRRECPQGVFNPETVRFKTKDEAVKALDMCIKGWGVDL